MDTIQDVQNPGVRVLTQLVTHSLPSLEKAKVQGI